MTFPNENEKHDVWMVPSILLIGTILAVVLFTLIFGDEQIASYFV